MPDSAFVQSPRRLRVFAFDPATGNQYANRRVRELTISLPWELDPVDRSRQFLGPRGEYLEVVDFDPASGAFYQPIDLNEPALLLSDGLEPSEENPKFHQQMVYAVAMQTISNFEMALGRVALWSSRGDEFVRRLRIYPHALREANAYYDPEKKALLFGYFGAGAGSRDLAPGSTVFTCLSQDIIVHETCHALLDGMHPRYVEPSNPDVLALHEAFADIVAIFQHFSFPEVLRDQIAKTRGDLEKQSLLGALAQEFGQALGRGGALRYALGTTEDGEWRVREPDNRLLARTTAVHDRGAILVAAVFRAFLTIYKDRIGDLLRIASSGSGILPEGELDPDLVQRLAKEASKSAQHVLKMCIRALDYCPPVNVTFGDYLRAIITADHDLYPEDENGYRRAFIEAFTSWGILPENLPIVTENNLLWPTLREVAADGDIADVEHFLSDLGGLLSQPSEALGELRQRGDMSDSAGTRIINELDSDAELIADRMTHNVGTRLRKRAYSKTPGRLSRENVLSRNLLEMGLSANREVEFLARKFYARLFWGLITNPESPALHELIGLTMDPGAPHTISRSKINHLPSVEVHSVRMANRLGNRDQVEREYVVEIVQSRAGYLDPEVQAKADRGEDVEKPRGDFRYRCGSTLLIDAGTYEIRRVIRTPWAVDQDAGLARQRDFRLRSSGRVLNAFDGPSDELPANAFANLHRHVEQGGFE